MSLCHAEMCPNWAGFGCVCDALDLDPPTTTTTPDPAPREVGRARREGDPRG